jgi:hypothetical protein
MTRHADKIRVNSVWHGIAMLTALYLLAGCSASPQCAEIDDAYVLTFLMQWQLEPSNNLKVSTLAEPKSAITEPKVQPSLEGATSLRIEIPFLSETAGASNGSDEIEVVPRPEPAAAQAKKPLFYDSIILYTSPACASCPAVKKALKDSGIPFDEHTSLDRRVPAAYIDGEEFEGWKILDRLNIPRPAVKEPARPTRLKGH